MTVSSWRVSFHPLIQHLPVLSQSQHHLPHFHHPPHTFSLFITPFTNTCIPNDSASTELLSLSSNSPLPSLDIGVEINDDVSSQWCLLASLQCWCAIQISTEELEVQGCNEGHTHEYVGTTLFLFFFFLTFCWWCTAKHHAKARQDLC